MIGPALVQPLGVCSLSRHFVSKEPPSFTLLRGAHRVCVNVLKNALDEFLAGFVGWLFAFVAVFPGCFFDTDMMLKRIDLALAYIR